ncbi:hypothetical protein AXA44_30915 [Rhodococcus sp. SC4]|nr:hypothetical protein AXA44_30915 [Rhodococcus sp. SC4]
MLSNLTDTPVDLLVVAVPAETTIELVAEAAAAGTGGALVLSSGFAEAGAKAAVLEGRLIQAAAGMPLIGPNSVGITVASESMRISPSPYVLREHHGGGRVGMVSQSGAVGLVLSAELERHGIGPDHFVSAGNGACLSAPVIAEYILSHADIDAVGLYLESVPEPAEIATLGELARSLNKAVVVLKSGTSAAGQRAAMSHTAAVAGDSLLFDGLCADAGIMLAASEEDFAARIAAAIARRNHGTGSIDSMAVVTMSGGAGALLADSLHDAGIDVPILNAQTHATLRENAPWVASDQNPVDLGGMFTAHLDQLPAVLKSIIEDPGIDALVLYLTFGDSLVPDYERLAATIAGLPKPAWMIWAGAQDQRLASAAQPGVLMPTIGAFARTLDRLREAALDHTNNTDWPMVGALSPSAVPLPIDRPVLTESASHRILQQYGMPYSHTATMSATGPHVVPHGWDSFPAVVKIDTPAAPHRARLGLVTMNVGDSDTLSHAISVMLDRARKAGLDLAEASVLVQEQRSSVGQFSLGVIRDSLYGAMLVVGPGGADVESVSHSRAAVPFPLTPRRQARVHALAEQISKSVIDRASLALILNGLDRLVDHHPTVFEVDLNPVLVGEDRSVVLVDSLMGIVTRPSPGKGQL